MAKLPPVPVGVAPGHSYWNDWYEKLRNLINSSLLNHNDLQNIQGGNTTERYHLTNSQHATLTGLPTISSGTWTPTLTNTTNITGSTAFTSYFVRVGSNVYCAGPVSIDPTAGSVLTTLTMTLPIASNFTLTTQAAGTANRGGSTAANIGALINSVSGASTVTLSYLNDADAANRTWNFTFMYTIL